MSRDEIVGACCWHSVCMCVQCHGMLMQDKNRSSTLLMAYLSPLLTHPQDIQEREHNLQKRMHLHDQKLKEKEAALEKAHEALIKKQELLEQTQQQLRELEDKKRPPRLKKFSIRKLIHWLSSAPAGEEGKVTEGPLPNLMKPKRTISSPAPAQHPSRTTAEQSAMGAAGKRQSLPTYSSRLGHRRQRSDGPSVGTFSNHFCLLAPFQCCLWSLPLYVAVLVCAGPRLVSSVTISLT